jgi:hypothetical protein
MRLIIDDKFVFDFKQSGKSSETESVEWFASSKIEDVEFEFLFNEKLFRKGPNIEIDWQYISSFLTKFIENKDFILQKSYNILLALNKEIGAWNEEKRTTARYELISIEILHQPLLFALDYKLEDYSNLFYSSSFQLFFKYIGLDNENYFIDAPSAMWYVNFFNGVVLQGVSREVL